jgi:hypothetical protein
LAKTRPEREHLTFAFADAGITPAFAKANESEQEEYLHLRKRIVAGDEHPATILFRSNY